jgi:hypothetical protein
MWGFILLGHIIGLVIVYAVLVALVGEEIVHGLLLILAIAFTALMIWLLWHTWPAAACVIAFLVVLGFLAR